MKLLNSLILLGGAALAMAGCQAKTPAGPPAQVAAPQGGAPVAPAPAAPAASAPDVAAPAAAEPPTPAAAPADAMGEMVMNWYGGEAYMGAPALDATAALIKAGGGPADFSFAKALVAMLGEDAVKAEVDKLTTQYGADKVKGFIDGMDFAVKTALKLATEGGVTLPEPAALEGAELAKALVKAGLTSDQTFWSGRLFDVALSHDLHNKVMAVINAEVSGDADELTHRILNQAMFDVAQALGLTDVKLATLH